MKKQSLVLMSFAMMMAFASVAQTPSAKPAQGANASNECPKPLQKEQKSASEQVNEEQKMNTIEKQAPVPAAAETSAPETLSASPAAQE